MCLRHNVQWLQRPVDQRTTIQPRRSRTMFPGSLQLKTSSLVKATTKCKGFPEATSKYTRALQKTPPLVFRIRIHSRLRLSHTGFSTSPVLPWTPRDPVTTVTLLPFIQLQKLLQVENLPFASGLRLLGKSTMHTNPKLR